MSKILFLTTHSLASNPRIVKEIKLAVDNGFKVQVSCFIFRNWSFDLNEKLLLEFKQRGVDFNCIEAGKEGGASWLMSVLKEKFYRGISQLFFLKSSVLSIAVSRRSNELLKSVNKIKDADWVIGHNPGALWATSFAGKKLHCKTGFDVEDYHPGEGNDKNLQRLTKNLMQQVLPNMDYVSFASPLIMGEIKKDISYNGDNWFTILNYFPASEFVLPETQLPGLLKLVWFSQNINSGRGLELILPAIRSNLGKVELHLYGNINEDFKKQNLDGMNNVFFYEPITQTLLHQNLSTYDVGLALDIPTDVNRNLVITNKLLAYLQAGLYVVASGTKSQKSFMKDFPDMGICFNYKKNDLNVILENVLNRRDIIRSNRKKRYDNFKHHTWETESKKLVFALKQIKLD